MAESGSILTIGLAVDTSQLLTGVQSSTAAFGHLHTATTQVQQSLQQLTQSTSQIQQTLQQLGIQADLDSGFLAHMATGLTDLQQGQRQTTQAILETAQAIQHQTQAFTQVRTDTLEYRKEQDALRQSQRRLAEEARTEATTFRQAWSTGLGVLGALGITATLHGIASAISDFVKDSVKGFAEFEQGMLKIATLIPGTTKATPAFQQMGKEIHDLSIATGIDLKDIQKAMFDVQSVFGMGRQAEALQVLKVAADLAVAGFTNVSVASTAVSSVLKEFQLNTSEATKVANALDVAALQNRQDFEQFAKALPLLLPSLKMFHLSLESAGAAMAVLTGNGLESSKAVTGLNQLFLAIAAPTARAEQYMAALARQLGVNKVEFQRFADGSVDLLATLQQFEGIQPDLFRRIFGSNIEAMRAAVILTSNLEDVRTKIVEAVNATDTFAERSKLAHSGIQQQWNESEKAARAYHDKVGEIIAQNAQAVTAIQNRKAGFIELNETLDKHRVGLDYAAEAWAAFGGGISREWQHLQQFGIEVLGTIGEIGKSLESWVVRFDLWLLRTMPRISALLGSAGSPEALAHIQERATRLGVLPAAPMAPGPAQQFQLEQAKVSPSLGADPYAIYTAELRRRGIPLDQGQALPSSGTDPYALYTAELRRRGIPLEAVSGDAGRLGGSIVPRAAASGAAASGEAGRSGGSIVPRERPRAGLSLAELEAGMDAEDEAEKAAPKAERDARRGARAAARKEASQQRASERLLSQLTREEAAVQMPREEAERFDLEEKIRLADLGKLEEATKKEALAILAHTQAGREELAIEKELRTERKERIKDLDIFGLNVSPEEEKARRAAAKVTQALARYEEQFNLSPAGNIITPEARALTRAQEQLGTPIPGEDPEITARRARVLGRLAEEADPLKRRTDQMADAVVGMIDKMAKGGVTSLKELGMTFEQTFLAMVIDTKALKQEISTFLRDVLQGLTGETTSKNASSIGSTIGKWAAGLLGLKPSPGAPAAPGAAPAAALEPNLLTEPMQSGGPAYADTPYLVGEAGPELFVPSTSGTVIPATSTATMMQAAQRPIQVVVYAQDAGSFLRSSGQIQRALGQAQHMAMRST